MATHITKATYDLDPNVGDRLREDVRRETAKGRKLTKIEIGLECGHTFFLEPEALNTIDENYKCPFCEA